MLLQPNKEASVPGLGKRGGVSCQALQTKVRTWTWTSWEADAEQQRWKRRKEINGT